ncbi:MAG: META domain-containing protein [Treponema sp.]|jgi:heat shock protein HslJ|nr:META domain-containing protein [Treponema sp.]
MQKIKKNSVKKHVIVLYLLLTPGLIALYAGGASAKAASFGDITGKDWLLSEVKTAGGSIKMDRQKLAEDNMAGVYSIRFDGERAMAMGMGAPNRYTAPFIAGEGFSLRMGPAAATLMMGIKEPEGLNEREYFAYLETVTNWALKGGTLELSCKDSSGGSAVLVFN